MFRQNPFRTIGAFAPSSKELALAMTRVVDFSKPQKILEVGAGTGAITKHLVAQMAPHHKVDVIEIVSPFAGFLKKRFEHHQNVTVHCQDILQLTSFEKYDCIISSLPFNSLPAPVTKSLIDHLIKLAKNNASMSFFEYKGFSRIARIFLTQKDLDNYQKTRVFIEKFIDRYQVNEASVKLNLPPALVHYLTIKK